MTITRIATFGADDRNLGRMSLWGSSAYPTLSTTKAYTGTYSYSHTGMLYPFGASFVNSTTAVRASFMFNHAGITTASGTQKCPVVTLSVGGAPMTIWYDQGTHEIKLQGGYEVSSTTKYYPVSSVPATALDTTSSWMSCGISAYIHSTSGFVSFYLNGIKVITWTGDTRIYDLSSGAKNSTITGAYAAGYETFDYGSLYSYWTANAYVDDFYIEALSFGDIVDSCPPNYKLLWYQASVAGVSTEWTPYGQATNVACVDEMPANDATDYVYAATLGLEDSYETTQPSIPDGYNVRAFTTLHRGRKLDVTSTYGVQPTISSYQTGSWVTDAHSESYTLSADWNEVEGHFDLNPSGGTWTNDDITDGFQIGQIVAVATYP